MKTTANALDPAHAGLMFLTPAGRPWVRVTEGKNAPSPNDEIDQAFRDLVDRLGIRRPRRSFYTLRRTFSTAADECNDANAKRRVMGHSLEGMDGHYDREISRERLSAVADAAGRKLLGRSPGRGVRSVPSARAAFVTSPNAPL